MVIMRTIGGQVEKMTINPAHIKSYLRAGWVEVKESKWVEGDKFKDVDVISMPDPTQEAAPKKMGRPKKQA